MNSILMQTTKQTDEGAFRLGESKIGGLPHLPEGFVWPEFRGKSLAFLAQVNLKDTMAFDKEHRLPEHGLLSFFFEGGEDVWGFDPKDKGGFKVLWSEDIDSLRVMEIPSDVEDYLRFAPCKITFECKESSPDESDDDEELDDTINKLLGYPDLIQGDIFLEAQLVTNGLYCGDSSGYNDPRSSALESGTADWQLLFQLDSDDNADMMWGDVGRVYFTIKQDDLKNRRFENAWLAFQCY